MNASGVASDSEPRPVLELGRSVARLVFATFMAAVGTLHFTMPEPFVSIMPPPLTPWALELVYVSGAAEILGGIGLLVPTTRPAARWWLIALLIAVFPANIYMATDNLPLGGTYFSAPLRWGRLPLQAVLIAIAWWTSSRGRSRATIEP